jgi:hypothetical protein
MKGSYLTAALKVMQHVIPANAGIQAVLNDEQLPCVHHGKSAQWVVYIGVTNDPRANSSMAWIPAFAAVTHKSHLMNP